MGGGVPDERGRAEVSLLEVYYFRNSFPPVLERVGFMSFFSFFHVNDLSTTNTGIRNPVSIAIAASRCRRSERRATELPPNARAHVRLLACASR